MWTFRVQFTLVFFAASGVIKDAKGTIFSRSACFCVTSWVLRLTIVQRVIGTFLIKRSERVVKWRTQK